ncbi:hypothetical protein ACFQ1I_30550 [Kitasatospora arboriphila]
MRGSSYIYTNDPMTPAQAQSYTDEGFEVGVHVTTNCKPWGTTANLQQLYSDQLGVWKAKYGSLPNPSSSRTHCVEWDDWATQAKTKLANGIRLDMDYYYYPSAFVQDRPGYFNGTGMIMKFADTDGSVIDEYQATTQLTDESGQSYPSTVTTLLDGAYGAKGYYAAIGANIHTDFAASSASDAVIAAAKARGVPVVSGLADADLAGRAQRLRLLQARLERQLADLRHHRRRPRPARHGAGELRLRHPHRDLQAGPGRALPDRDDQGNGVRLLRRRGRLLHRDLRAGHHRAHRHRHRARQRRHRGGG